MSRPGSDRLRSALLRFLGSLHARGFHAAVLAGLIMMPSVAAVGFLTEREHQPQATTRDDLRGTLDAAHHHPDANRSPAANVAVPADR